MHLPLNYTLGAVKKQGLITIVRAGHRSSEHYVTVYPPHQRAVRVDPRIEYWRGTCEFLPRDHCVASFIEGLMKVGWNVTVYDHRYPRMSRDYPAVTHCRPNTCFTVPQFVMYGQLFGLGLWEAYCFARRSPKHTPTVG